MKPSSRLCLLLVLSALYPAMAVGLPKVDMGSMLKQVKEALFSEPGEECEYASHDQVDMGFDQETTCALSSSEDKHQREFVDSDGHCWFDNFDDTKALCSANKACHFVVEDRQTSKYEPRRNGHGLETSTDHSIHFKTKCPGLQATMDEIEDEICMLMDMNSVVLVDKTIFYKTDHKINGVQMDLVNFPGDSKVVAGAVHNSGFTTSAAAGRIVSFSMNLLAIPEGCGPLMDFDQIPNDAKISEVIMAAEGDSSLGQAKVHSPKFKIHDEV